jgi:hypothetical protein
MKEKGEADDLEASGQGGNDHHRLPPLALLPQLAWRGDRRS